MINLMRHLAYFKYLMRHKWFVWVAGRKLGCPAWRLIMHDMSKLFPHEWGPYARCFYTPDGKNRYVESYEFNVAWLKHQHYNPHHWQHWMLRQDDGDTIAMAMPHPCVLEMVADWMGAGRAITGKWDITDWWENNSHKMTLNPTTRTSVDWIIEHMEPMA